MRRPAATRIAPEPQAPAPGHGATATPNAGEASGGLRASVLARIVLVMLLWALCFPLIAVGLSMVPPFHFAAARAFVAGGGLLVLVAAPAPVGIPQLGVAGRHRPCGNRPGLPRYGSRGPVRRSRLRDLIANTQPYDQGSAQGRTRGARGPARRCCRRRARDGRCCGHERRHDPVMGLIGVPYPPSVGAMTLAVAKQSGTEETSMPHAGGGRSRRSGRLRQLPSGRRTSTRMSQPRSRTCRALATAAHRAARRLLC